MAVTNRAEAESVKIHALTVSEKSSHLYSISVERLFVSSICKSTALSWLIINLFRTEIQSSNMFCHYVVLSCGDSVNITKNSDVYAVVFRHFFNFRVSIVPSKDIVLLLHSDSGFWRTTLDKYYAAPLGLSTLWLYNKTDLGINNDLTVNISCFRFSRAGWFNVFSSLFNVIYLLPKFWK